MDTREQARYEARARIIKALAHPTRLLFVEQLKDGPRCVCELTDMVEADVSTVSKHLSVLKNAGIVSDTRRGSQVYYSLRCPCILNFLECIESVLRTTVEDQLALVR